jgi:hypothetical protein
MKQFRMNRGLVTGAVVAAAGITVGMGGVGYAATGGSFILGHSNSADTVSTLTGTAGTPLKLNAPVGRAPLAVSSGTKVTNLNADRIDGLDSTSLQRAGTVVRESAPTYTPSEGPINRQARAFCLTGEHAVGGGAHVSALTDDRLGEYYTFLVHSAPVTAAGEPTGIAGQQAAGWLVEATNTAHALTGQSGRDANLVAYVVCARN